MKRVNPFWALYEICNEIMVFASGETMACCPVDFASFKLGVFPRSKIHELWNNSEALALRRMLEQGRLSPVCQRCIIDKSGY